MASQPPINDIAIIDQAEDAVLTAIIEVDARPRFLRTVAGCHVCNSEKYRVLIESWFTRGMKAATVVERLGPDAGISVQSINRHFARHHCVLDAALKQLPYWKKAYEQGIDLHSFDEQMSKALFATELIYDQFMKDLVDGTFAPDSKDYLKAISMLWEMEKERKGSSGQYDSQQMFIVIRIMMDHVRALISHYAPSDTEDAMAYFNRRLQGDPILKDLIEQTRVSDVIDEDDGFANETPIPIAPPGTVVDAEVVDSSPETVSGLLPDEEVDWDAEEPWEE